MSKFASPFLLIILLLSSVVLHAGKYPFRPASRLSEGAWIKVRMTESGVYRLTYDEVKEMGFSDPSKVRLYGLGGPQLSENFFTTTGDSTKADDLPLVPVHYSNPANSLTASGDYLLFWGRGVVSWTFSSTNKAFTHSYNTYSSYGYYFLSDRSFGEQPLVIENESALSYEPTVKDQTNYTHPTFHDLDEVSLGKTGRVFLGEDFQYQTSRSFSFAIPDLEPTQHRIQVNLVAKTAGNTFSVSANGTSIGSIISKEPSGYAVGTPLNVIGNYTSPRAESSINVTLVQSKQGDSNAYLDYILINAVRTLKLNNGVVHFRCPATSNQKIRYRIQGATPETVVWNVTDPNCPKRITGSQLTGSELSFVASQSQYAEYVAFDYSAAKYQLAADSWVSNQNLHALPQTDYVMVAPSLFVDQAERLADYHRQNSGLRVTIVTDKQLYNEYSSGAPDAMAYRWFLKQFYDRATTEVDKPSYLLLFGDCSFDNRGVTKLYKSSGLISVPMLLSYQFHQSLDEASAVMTDDFFGYLDDAEGDISSSGKADVGIGRFPVRTHVEAQAVVDKTIRYMSNPEKGNWKNQLTLLAEDLDNQVHMIQAETMADVISGHSSDMNKGFIFNKIYFDNYVPEISGGNKRFPEVERQLLSTINSGTLMLNYIGHGSPTSMSKSIVMTQSTVASLYNKRLPLWITATCDFSRFDEYITSIGELALLNPRGGAIALFSTTRIAYIGTNEKINSAFCKYVFDKDANGKRLRLGDILRKTKNSLNFNWNYLNFGLLGDPALTLAYPEYHTRVTKVNDVEVSQNIEDFKALAKMTVEGEILDPSGAVDESFSGMIVPQVYDVEMKLKTRGNIEAPYEYKDRNLVLFSGRDSVRNGRFKFSFFMPRDISYQNGEGLINFYAYDNRNNEAQGSFGKFKVGGTDLTAVNDNVGPVISPIYLNAPDFQNGGMVNEEPTFYARMSDPKGFNLSTWAVGHDMSLVIDEDYERTYSLNRSFECVSGSATEGFVKYKLPTLSEGRHQLTFRAWDTFNNSTIETVEFEVKNGYKPRIFDLTTDRNPVSISRDGQARFFLVHNRPNIELTVKVSVFNLSGVEVWSSVENGVSDIFDSYPLTWDLSVQNGIKAFPGIYIYRAIITTDGVSQATQSRKIAIIN